MCHVWLDAKKAADGHFRGEAIYYTFDSQQY